MHLTCSLILVMSYIYIFYIHILTMHALVFDELYFTFSIHLIYVHISCISSDYIIILYSFIFALMYTFMHF